VNLQNETCRPTTILLALLTLLDMSPTDRQELAIGSEIFEWMQRKSCASSKSTALGVKVCTVDELVQHTDL
jgi:hypothetical protein